MNVSAFKVPLVTYNEKGNKENCVTYDTCFMKSRGREERTKPKLYTDIQRKIRDFTLQPPEKKN